MNLIKSLIEKLIWRYNETHDPNGKISSSSVNGTRIIWLCILLSIFAVLFQDRAKTIIDIMQVLIWPALLLLGVQAGEVFIAKKNIQEKT